MQTRVGKSPSSELFGWYSRVVPLRIVTIERELGEDATVVDLTTWMEASNRVMRILNGSMLGVRRAHSAFCSCLISYQVNLDGKLEETLSSSCERVLPAERGTPVLNASYRPL